MIVSFDEISDESSLLVFCADKEIVDNGLTKDLISFTAFSFSASIEFRADFISFSAFVLASVTA